MRELQQIATIIFSALPAALKIVLGLTVAVVLIRLIRAHVKDWRGALPAQDAAYTLAGLSAIIWALSR